MRPAEIRPPRPRNIYRSGVAARVKWFDAAKGFGFVTPEDGSSEAFLPAAALKAAGYESVPQGTRLVCDLTQGQKGPQVATVGEVDLSTATARGPRGAAKAVRAAPAPRAPAATSAFGREVAGTVKFYDARRGFGYITPDKGTTDIYLHASALKRSGLEFLQPQVRVRVFTKQGPKGVEAERVEFL